MDASNQLPAVGGPQRSRRWKLLRIPLLTVVGLSAVYFATVYYQVWLQAQVDEAQPADAIVVLGAAQYLGRPSPVLKARLDHALELYRRGLAPHIITTGGHGPGSKFAEGDVGQDYLLQQGVSAEAVIADSRGRSTAESAEAVAEIMRQKGLASCIVVSDGYHIRRIKSMLEARGLVVYGSPRSRGSDSTWERSKYYAREALGYILWRLGVQLSGTLAAT